MVRRKQGTSWSSTSKRLGDHPPFHASNAHGKHNNCPDENVSKGFVEAHPLQNATKCLVNNERVRTRDGINDYCHWFVLAP